MLTLNESQPTCPGRDAARSAASQIRDRGCSARSDISRRCLVHPNWGPGFAAHHAFGALRSVRGKRSFVGKQDGSSAGAGPARDAADSRVAFAALRATLRARLRPRHFGACVARTRNLETFHDDGASKPVNQAPRSCADTILVRLFSQSCLVPQPERWLLSQSACWGRWWLIRAMRRERLVARRPTQRIPKHSKVGWSNSREIGRS